MAIRNTLRPCLIVIALCIISLESKAQFSTTHYNFHPDLWYNSVDGVRVGVLSRSKEMSLIDTTLSRLDAGLWLGTSFPGSYLSYYFNYELPISYISTSRNPGIVEFNSFKRTGFVRHGISLKKVFRNKNNEKTFTLISLNLRRERRTNSDYIHFPEYWRQSPYTVRQFTFTFWNKIYEIGVKHHIDDGATKLVFDLSYMKNYSKNAGTHMVDTFWDFEASVTAKHYFNRHSSFRFRLFSTYISSVSPDEYTTDYAGGKYVNWLDNGFTRADGIFSKSFIENGYLHMAGGANIRGYTKDMFTFFNSQVVRRGRLINSVNTELSIPNPFPLLYSGDKVRIDTYGFFDVGMFVIDPVTGIILSDAGFGMSLSLELPEVIGKRKRIFIRYDLPVYIFQPMRYGLKPPEGYTDEYPILLNDLKTEPGFKFRHLLGIGAVFDL